jgi:hypothetical protein
MPSWGIPGPFAGREMIFPLGKGNTETDFHLLGSNPRVWGRESLLKRKLLHLGLLAALLT